MRPAHLAANDSSDIDALLHALDALASPGGYVPDAIVELQATSPLIDAGDILGALEQFRRDRAPLVTVTPVSKPLAWTVTLDGDRVSPVLAAASSPARAYQLNGAISIITPDTLRRAKTFFTSDTTGYVLPLERSADIDTALDFAWAEWLHARAGHEGDGAAIDVAGRTIGTGRCFLIAEAGVNHNGDVALAHRLVDAAADAGADAVKFQTFRADLLCAPDAPKEQYQKTAAPGDESQLAMLEALSLPWEAHVALKQHAEQRGLVFMSTPFDEQSADDLLRLDVAAFKIGSGEATHLPLLRHVARAGRPVLLSTGMCTLDEVATAVRTIRENGNPPLALLHCVSCYPADAADSNLKAMDTMRAMFGVPVGFSDHTLGIDVAIAAVARGASVLEKHLTLDTGMPGPDHRASLDPAGFAALAAAVRRVDDAIGDGRKRPMPAEEEGRLLGRRSLCAAVDIKAGDTIEPHMLAVLRPGGGVPPADFDRWIGRRAARDFPAGAQLVD